MLCPCVCPFNLLLQPPVLPTPVSRLLSVSFFERCNALSGIEGGIDPGYIDTVFFLLDPTETFAAEPFCKAR